MLYWGFYPYSWFYPFFRPRWFWALSMLPYLSYWAYRTAPYPWAWSPYRPFALTKEQELEMLRNDAQMLTQELERINREIEVLEKSKS